MPDPDSEEPLLMIEKIGREVGEAYGVKPLPKTLPAQEREDTHHKRAIGSPFVLASSTLTLGREATEAFGTAIRADPFQKTQQKNELEEVAFCGAGPTSSLASAFLLGAFSIGECIEAWRESQEEKNKPKPSNNKP